MNDYISFNVNFVGADGSMEYNRYLKTLEITMHGAPFNANHMSAITLAKKIKQVLSSSVGHRPIHLDEINEVRLYCCWSAFGGAVSVANVLATYLNKTVRAYDSRYCPPGTAGGYDNKDKIFLPQPKNFIRKNAHRVLHFTSNSVILPICRVMRR